MKIWRRSNEHPGRDPVPIIEHDSESSAKLTNSGVQLRVDRIQYRYAPNYPLHDFFVDLSQEDLNRIFEALLGVFKTEEDLK